MIDEDKKKFAEILIGLGMYYNQTIEKPVMRLYWEALRQYTVEDVDRAANLHTRDPDQGRFMPKVADLIRILEGGGQSRAELAWSKVQAALSSAGRYESVVFDDAIIHCVIRDMGGWVTVCDIPAKQSEFKHAEFVKRYAAYAQRGMPDNVPPRMIGECEVDNRTKGYPIAPPTFVGDPDKCREIARLPPPRTMVSIGQMAQAALPSA